MRTRHLAWELALMSASAVASLMHAPPKNARPPRPSLFGAPITLADVDLPPVAPRCFAGDRMPVIRPQLETHYHLRVHRPDPLVRYSMPVATPRLCDDALDDRAVGVARPPDGLPRKAQTHEP